MWPFATQHRGADDGKGFAAVRKIWTWPEAPRYPPFPLGPLTLAPGRPGQHENHDGRHIVLAQMRRLQRPVLLELGVFLGGSMHRWLNGSIDARIVGVDPFFNVTDYVAKWVGNDGRYQSYRSAIAQLAAPHGSFDTAVAANWPDRERACLIQGFSPAILPRLRTEGLRPDVVFIDNDKSMHDLWIAHALWPEAVLAGDDWGHRSHHVLQAPVRTAKLARVFRSTNDAAYNVCAFARKMGFCVEAKSVTWLLHRGARPAEQPDPCKYAREVNPKELDADKSRDPRATKAIASVRRVGRRPSR